MRDALIGVVAVALGHAAVLVGARVLEGDDAILSFTAVALILLGLVQLVYVRPLLVYGLWRRRALAAGAGAAALLTMAFSLLGFFAT